MLARSPCTWFFSLWTRETSYPLVRLKAPEHFIRRAADRPIGDSVLRLRVPKGFVLGGAVLPLHIHFLPTVLSGAPPIVQQLAYEGRCVSFYRQVRTASFSHKNFHVINMPSSDPFAMLTTLLFIIDNAVIFRADSGK
jgi:hypothetical protein